MTSSHKSYSARDERSHGYSDDIMGVSKLHCCGANARRKNKLLFSCVFIVIVMWFLATFLLFLTKKEKALAIVTSHLEEPRNVFEQFNSHKIIFRGLNAEEDYNYMTAAANKTPQELKHIQSLPSKLSLEGLRFEPNNLLPQVDCASILQGDLDAIEQTTLKSLELKSKKYAKKLEKLAKWEDTLMKMIGNCTNFLGQRKYITTPLTAEEKAYPIAYIITIHKKFSIFERLLRSIYHPQNIYCIHVDKKSPDEFINSVRKLSQCFGNVFVASNLTEVHYTHWSRVQADLNCFSDLVEKKKEIPWKYVINLCGQDFSLKTNLEITRALKSFHGFNNMETVTPPSNKKRRYEFHFKLPQSSNSEYALMAKTDIRKDPSPLDTPMFVGSAYYIWKRQAVEFMLTDRTIRSFFHWSEDAYSPDEHVWATLQRWYPKMPGSFPPHEKYDSNELQSVTRLVKWGGLDTSVYPKCAGKYSRGVCVYGVGDLTWLIQQHHFFANKFDYDTDPFAVDCLDMWLRNRTIAQTSRYISMGYV